MSREVMSTPGDFGQAIEIYKQNYVEYKTTGRAEYKTAYETAESWIKQYLEGMQSRIQQSATTITNFVDKNVDAHTELGHLNAKLQTIKREGPASQDKYITLKRINAEVPQDNTDLYVKAGIIAGLVGVVAVISAF